MWPALAPLRLAGFRRLALAYNVNELGNWLGEIALAVLVFDQTGNALATAALFVGMQFVPAVFAQGFVARVEVTGTRVGLPLVYAGEGATFLVLAAIADDFLLPVIVALAAVDGTLALAGRAFTRAAVSETLAPSGQLREGNAIINVGFTAAGALGPLLAGLVVAGIGPREALLLDAASFFLVALLLATSRSIPDVKSEPEPWRERLRQGLEYVGRHPILKRLIAAQAAAFVFFAAVIPIEIVYVKDSLDAGDSGYGTLLASWGVGMVLGSLVFALARKTSLKLLLFWSTVIVGAAYLAMAGAQTLLTACLAAALGGLGNGVQWVAVMSAIQGLTSQRYQARVVALLESSGFAMPGIGFMLGGVLAYLIDPRATFVVAGAGVMVVVAIAVPLLRKTEWPETGEVADEPLAAAAEVPLSGQAVRPGATPDLSES
jgi:MFS family permease